MRVHSGVRVMSDESDDIFLREMADVTPLRSKGGCRMVSKPASPTPGQLYSREAAQRTGSGDDGLLPTAFIEPIPAEAIISYRRPGIQDGVYRRLYQGGYPIEAMLDLHGYTIDQSSEELQKFIKNCLDHDVRVALISHGKGKSNKDQISVLKACVNRWLPLFAEVMAFHSALKCHGGAGAVYVLLKKSERAKDLTRHKLGLATQKPVV